MSTETTTSTSTTPKNNNNNNNNNNDSDSFLSLPPSLLTICTFNILAPAFKRMNSMNLSGRESDYPQIWQKRHEEIIQLLLASNAHIICLQEFYFETEFIEFYTTRLEHYYTFYGVQRTRGREDGEAKTRE